MKWELVLVRDLRYLRHDMYGEWRSHNRLSDWQRLEILLISQTHGGIGLFGVLV